VGFFVCGIMGKFGDDLVYIADTIYWAGLGAERIQY